MAAGYLIDWMLSTRPVDDFHAGYYAIDNFTKPFPSVVVLFQGSSGPLHLAYITSCPLEVLWVDITSQEPSYDSLLS